MIQVQTIEDGQLLQQLMHMQELLEQDLAESASRLGKSGWSQSDYLQLQTDCLNIQTEIRKFKEGTDDIQPTA